MTYRVQDGSLVPSKTPHTCICDKSSEKVVGSIIDVKDEIKELVLDRALTDVTIVAEKLAREILKDVEQRHAGKIYWIYL
jgi:hypothetical protein